MKPIPHCSTPMGYAFKQKNFFEKFHFGEKFKFFDFFTSLTRNFTKQIENSIEAKLAQEGGFV